MKDFIILTSPDKPIPQAGKGTVQRYATLKLYADEFKALFAHLKPPMQLLNGESKGMPNGLSNGSPNGIREGISDAPNASPRLAASSLLPTDGITYSTDDLDARIEAVLDRVFPDALLKHLGPALAQIMVDSFRLPTFTVNRSNSADRHQGNTSKYFDDKRLDESDSAIDAEASSGSSQYGLQIQEPRLEPHHNGTNGADSHSVTEVKPIYNSAETLRDSLYRIVQSVTYLYGPEDVANLFDCGLDSLQVPVLVDEINAVLVKSRPDIRLLSVKELYPNRSIEKLLIALEPSPDEVNIGSVRIAISA